MNIFRLNTIGKHAGVFALSLFLSAPAVAYLPADEANAPEVPARASQRQARPSQRVSQRPHPAKRPVAAKKPHAKHKIEKPKTIIAKKDWCEQRGGEYDEDGDCVKNYTEEECAEEFEGTLNEEGLCIANHKVCDEKQGNINEYGVCIY